MAKRNSKDADILIPTTQVLLSPAPQNIPPGTPLLSLPYPFIQNGVGRVSSRVGTFRNSLHPARVRGDRASRVQVPVRAASNQRLPSVNQSLLPEAITMIFEGRNPLLMIASISVLQGSFPY